MDKAKTTGKKPILSVLPQAKQALLADKSLQPDIDFPIGRNAALCKEGIPGTLWEQRQVFSRRIKREWEFRFQIIGLIPDPEGQHAQFF